MCEKSEYVFYFYIIVVSRHYEISYFLLIKNLRKGYFLSNLQQDIKIANSQIFQKPNKYTQHHVNNVELGIDSVALFV